MLHPVAWVQKHLNFLSNLSLYFRGKSRSVGGSIKEERRTGVCFKRTAWDDEVQDRGRGNKLKKKHIGVTGALHRTENYTNTIRE